MNAHNSTIPFPKAVAKTGRIVRVWIAKLIKLRDMYECVKEYIILFVDQDDNPLHDIHLQLAEIGCFQFYFIKKFVNLEHQFFKFILKMR